MRMAGNFLWQAGLICLSVLSVLFVIYISNATHHIGATGLFKKTTTGLWKDGVGCSSWTDLYQNRYHGHQTTQVIITTISRTGSTFTSEFFRQNRDVFYTFEPLFLPKFEDRLLQAESFLSEVLSCNISHLRDVKKRNWLHFMLCHPTVIYSSVCGKGGVNMTEAAALCKRRSVVATKTIRVEHLWYLTPLMSDAGVRVIMLIRDPRGVMHSRLRENTERTYEMSHRYCTNSVADLEYIHAIMQSHTSRDRQLLSSILLLRYEDIALHPLDALHLIYNTFLKLTPDTHVTRWAREMESRARGNYKNMEKVHEIPGNTFRNNPAAIPEKWRKALSWEHVKVIQEACGPLMKMMGYRMAKSEKEMRMMTFSYVLPFSPDDLFAK